MKEKIKGSVLRRVLSILMALTLLILCGETVPEARAAEKTLSITPGHYVRWRRGLPPKDGEWYRILLIDPSGDDEFMQGDTVKDDEVDDEPDAKLQVPAGYELNDVFPDFDTSRDVNYSLHYYHTPAVRFAQYDNKNNHDAAAPMYYFRLADWTGDEGNLTDIGMAAGEGGATNRTTLGRRNGMFVKTGVPWAFVSAEYDDSVDDDKVVVEQFRQGGTGQSWHLHQGSMWGEYTLWYTELGMWMMSPEFILYYGDEITMDTIADGQVIEDNEIVNIGKNSFLTLADGYTLTVKDGGILSVAGGLYNDGTVRVEKGGTLIVQEDAFVMPQYTGQKAGSIVCDGGDVIIYSGGRVVCEGPSGFKFAGENGRFGTVYNYGAIITSALTAKGKARSFHNEGSVMLGYTVNSRSAQSFRDGTLTITSGKASVTGLKTGKINVDQVTDGVITGNGVVRP